MLEIMCNNNKSKCDLSTYILEPSRLLSILHYIYIYIYMYVGITKARKHVDSLCIPAEKGGHGHVIHARS